MKLKHAAFLWSSVQVGLVCVSRMVAADLSPTLVSEWPGGPTGGLEDVSFCNGYVYFSGTYQLGCQVVDVRDAVTPRRIGYSNMRVNGRTRFSGNFAYVPGDTGLQVLDMTDPRIPRRVGSLEIPAVQDIAIAGNYAFVVGGPPYSDGWLYAVDISDPGHLVEVGSFAVGAAALHVEASGSTVHVVGRTESAGSYQWTVDCIDASNPAQLRRVGHLQQTGWVTDAAFAGDYLYISVNRDDLNNGGVQVVEVSDAANPRWVAGYNNNRKTDRLAISGNYLYLNKASNSGQAGLDILDISIPASIQKVGTYFGGLGWGSVAVAGNFAYLTAGARMEIVEISNPVSPQRRGSWRTYPYAQFVAHAGDFTYVAGNSDLTFLDIFDTSDLTNPQWKGSASVSGPTRGLRLLGNYAYLVTGTGLHAVDVSNPQAPRRTGGAAPLDYFRDIAFAGDYALVADQEAGVQLLTITNRASPRRLANFFANSSAPVYAVCTASNVAFVVSRSFQGGWYSTVKVVDITNPRTPTELGSYQTEGLVSRCTVWGHYLYLPKWVPQNAFGGQPSGMLEILDVDNPTNPQLLSQYETTESALDVEVSDGRAYVACSGATVAWETAGLNVIDVSDPLRPRRVGGYQGKSFTSVTVEGERAYVAGGSLQIIDLSQRARLARVADLDTSDLACGMAMIGTELLIADRSSGIQVVDVSVPLIPKLTTSIASTEPVWGVSAAGTTAFAASDTAGVQSFHLADPANPQPLGVYDTPGTARGIALSGQNAYVADGEAGLLILNVSNPANMQPLGALDTRGTAKSVALMGDYALVAAADHGVVIVDISNPQLPRIVGQYNAGGDTECIAVVGSNALISDGYAGFQVLDLSNPAKPKLLARAPAEGPARSMTVSGRFAYVADANVGVQVYDLSDLTHPRRMGGTSAVNPYALVVSGDYVFAASGRDGLAVCNAFVPPLNVLVSPAQTSGDFSLRVDGPAGSSVRIQRSSDLVNWQDWQTVMLGNMPTTIHDAIVAGASRRFYRAVQ